MPKNNPDVNERFWQRRIALELSRSAVADIANQQPMMRACEHVPLDDNYIGRIEQGRIGGGMCGERLAAICATLQVEDPAEVGLVAERRTPTSTAPPRRRPRGIRGVDKSEWSFDLPGENEAPVESQGFEEPDADMKRRRVVAGLVSPAIAALADAMMRPFDRDLVLVDSTQKCGKSDDLASAVAEVRTAYQHSQYGAAYAALPGVLAGLRRTSGGMEARRVAGLEVQAYQVASGLMLKGGEAVLAAVAAERCTAAAERTDDELAIACGARAFAHCLMAVGHAREGVRLVITAADRLSASVSMNDPAALSVYGALLLRGAIAAAQEEDRDQAHDLLKVASGTASHLGQDGNLLWTAFGPTNVMAHRVSVAVELGDAGSAIAYARDININAIELPERRAMVCLDTARAFAQWGKADAAFRAIREAERHAPEEVRRRPAVHKLIDELAQRSSTTLRRDVRQYAARIRASA